MVVSSKVNGLTIICMVWAYTLGLTVVVTWASTKTIRNMATEFINGPMEESIWVSGCEANNTALASTKQLTRIVIHPL